ncbi:tektin-1 [Denticeps clupeoides]|uniref:Tektin n=1 Tax=Denticeps clupeoides TaxID=299321 RepID=A0AAY4ERM6_9TELE|nr:tektin-1 [Denticeps clupeoides]
MSRIMEPPQKFLPQDWRRANDVQYNSAEAERTRSERLTAECKRLMEESDKCGKRMQQDTNQKLEHRIRDIKFWRMELKMRLDEMLQEIKTLMISRGRVERALESCTEPLRVTTLCLSERQKRVGIDLVHDEVEQELVKEMEITEGVAALLQRTLEQSNEQIRLNRSAVYYLEKDLRDKFQAEQIDDSCSVLTNTSSNNDDQLGKAMCLQFSRTIVTPEEWESFSDVNISKADKERSNSLSLRALVDRVLEQTATDMRNQYKSSSVAMEHNIQEVKSTKSLLEEHLCKVLAEIGSQERNLEYLKVAIGDKEGPLKVAQARLSARSQRPNVELCHDPAHLKLLSEVQELTAHVNRLKEAQSQSELELRALTRRQLALEEEIQIKSHSLYIDEVICTQLRQPIVIQSF